MATWNIGGFTAAKTTDIARVLEDEQVDVLCLQELHWSRERTSINIPGYNAITNPRNSKGGGVALYIRSSLPHQPQRALSSGTTGLSEEVYATLELGPNHILVGSCYLPPPAQVPSTLFATSLQLHHPTIIGGDLNSHHEWWSNGTPNDPGRQLRDLLDDTGLSVSGLDQSLATFPRNQGRPDLLLSSNVTECRTWVVEIHVSDHFPLLTTYDLAWEYQPSPHDNRPRLQFEQADWPHFQTHVDEGLDPRLARRLQTLRHVASQQQREACIEQGAAHFHAILRQAAKAIPKTTRPPGIPPFWNAACQHADTHCRLQYGAYQATPTPATWHQYLEAKHARAETLAEQKRQLFGKRLANLDPARAADWNLVKSRDRGADLRGTIIDGKSGLTAKANHFARRFAPPTTGARMRVPRHAACPRVTMPELEAALHKTKRHKAPGPDGIHPEFLKDGLGPLGRLFLLHLIDASVFTGYLPRTWKHAHWLPILKPTKPPEDSGSYRPISLTSVVSKVAERVVDTRIRADPAFNIDTRQHAFRRAHRTEDALARLVDTANRAWNDTYNVRYEYGAGRANWIVRSGRATATLLDLTSAFDNLRHDRLHQLLRKSAYPAYIIRWTMAFLTGRTAQVAIHGVTSKTQRLTRGAPQGTVLGPLLFLHYIDPLVSKLRQVEHIDPILFADDITVVAVGRTAAECATTTQTAVDEVMAWCDEQGLPLAPAKTKALLLTPATISDETNAGLQIGPVHVPIERVTAPGCKLLGVHLDSKLGFHHHIVEARARASMNLRLLRHASTHMGPSTIALRTFGKALVESRLFYAVGGWGAALSDDAHNSLEITQRDMARAATGLVSASPSAGTLLEANLIPASVVTRTQVAALIERWRRLPANDIRYTIVHQPLPPPPTGVGRIPYFPHPWTAPQRLIQQVLESRSVPIQHHRLPLLLARRTAPHLAAPAQHILIYPNALDAPPDLPEKGTEEGDRIRLQLNHATWDDLLHCHGPFDAEIWTDGGVLHAESPDCISASAGHLYLAADPQPHATFTASAGRLACSYTAEFVALTGSLRQFAPLIPSGSKVLIGVDSQSLLQALHKGPLLTEEDFEDELWHQFLALARRDCHVVLQFFYSHVHFPPRNEAVDDVVTSLLEDPHLNHDDAVVWLTDVVRAIHHHLYANWLDGVEDSRTALCGVVRAPLREMAAWSREDQTIFSRSRTDTLPELGTYRNRLGITSTLACRWCGLSTAPHPALATALSTSTSATESASGPPDNQHQPQPLPATSVLPQPAPSNNHTNAPTAPTNPPRHTCIHCPLTYANRTTLLAHMDRAHPRDPRPAVQGSYPCECGCAFDRLRSRAVHRRVCPIWQALTAAAPRPAPLPIQHSAESVLHLFTCPGLQHLRQQLGIVTRDHSPPVSEAITDRKMVDFLRAALAMVEPPAPTPAAPHPGM